MMLLLIGSFLVGLALAVWYMPLARRAELFGPFLTERGFRALFRGWPLVFMMGMLITVTGISKYVFFAAWHGDVQSEIANGIGTAEAIFSVLVAGSIGLLAFRAWRAR